MKHSSRCSINISRNKIFRRAFVSIVFAFFIEPSVILAKQPATSPAAVETPQSIAEGIKTPAFSKAYKRAFAPYLGLKWVSSPVLETPPKKVLVDGKEVAIFFACRPHACQNERLSFVYESISGKGWGVINLKSDIQGDALTSAIEALLNKEVEAKK